MSVLPRPVGLRDIVGDVGGERRLAHTGAARNDDEVGFLQAAHLLVEIGEARRDAGQVAVALIGGGGHVDGDLERGVETLEAALVAPRLGQLVEMALGLFDLPSRRVIGRRVIGAVDDFLAYGDQVAPDRRLVDRAAIIGCIDDGRGVGRKPHQILRHGQPAEIGVRQETLERDRRRDLAGADQRAHHVVDAPVNIFGEMLRLQKIRNAVKGLVVDQDRAQQRRLRLDIMRCGAVIGLRLLNRQASIIGGECCHDPVSNALVALRLRRFSVSLAPCIRFVAN